MPRLEAIGQSDAIEVVEVLEVDLDDDPEGDDESSPGLF